MTSLVLLIQVMHTLPMSLILASNKPKMLPNFTEVTSNQASPMSITPAIHASQVC
jgi:hypothetical protein